SSREQRIAQREKVKERRAEERTAERTSEINNRIFDFIRVNGKSSCSQIEKGVGGNASAVREAVKALQEAGTLIVAGKTPKGGGTLLDIADLIGTELDGVGRSKIWALLWRPFYFRHSDGKTHPTGSTSP
ncbi:mediator of RNA polymerase II transcription subunit 11 family protein, partial [Aeromonas rivipollensis]|uniref:hypothetical protein n=1 Tax=Aeromonas rivipollensis TaxID=948519 RepID=UPI0038DB54C7